MSASASVAGSDDTAPVDALPAQEEVDHMLREANEEDLQQGTAAMNQWRTQWEEELTEKSSIDAELLTLRSEFEKSSATYDREIEGLKEPAQPLNAPFAESGCDPSRSSNRAGLGAGLLYRKWKSN